MRSADKLDSLERPLQIRGDAALPAWMEMDVEFINQHHTGRLAQNVHGVTGARLIRPEQVGIERDSFDGNVRYHRQHHALPSAQVVERLLVTTN